MFFRLCLNIVPVVSCLRNTVFDVGDNEIGVSAKTIRFLVMNLTCDVGFEMNCLTFIVFPFESFFPVFFEFDFGCDDPYNYGVLLVIWKLFLCWLTLFLDNLLFVFPTGSSATIFGGKSYDCSVRIWDVALHQQFAELRSQSSQATSVAFDRNGKYLVSGRPFCVRLAYADMFFPLVLFGFYLFFPRTV